MISRKGREGGASGDSSLYDNELTNELKHVITVFEDDD